MKKKFTLITIRKSSLCFNVKDYASKELVQQKGTFFGFDQRKSNEFIQDYVNMNKYKEMQQKAPTF